MNQIMDKATHYLLFIPKTGTTVLYLLVFTIYHFCKSFAKNITGAISKRPTTTDPADQSIAGQYIDVSPKLISQSTNNTETPIATEDYLNLHLYGPPNGTNIFHVAMFLKCIAALNTTHTIIGNAIENIAMGLIGSLNYNQAHLTTLATNRNYIITTEWQGLAELLFDTDVYPTELIDGHKSLADYIFMSRLRGTHAKYIVPLRFSRARKTMYSSNPSSPNTTHP